MPFKIAVIGCGWVSSARHAPAYQEYARSHPGVSLSACCDLDQNLAEHYREQFGFQRAYTNYLEMLDFEKPQVVCLNVPEHLTCNLACAIMDQGYPLITEKPPGLSNSEIDRLISMAVSSGVINQVAFNRRFMPLVTGLKGMINSLAIHHLEIQMNRVHRLDRDFATTAVHDIDLARYLLGSDYQEVQFSYQELPEVGPGVANIALTCRFASQATGHLSFFPVSGIDIERVIVHALDHSFYLEMNEGLDAPGRLRHYHQGQLVYDQDAVQLTQRREDYYLNGFYHENATFFDAIQAGVQTAHGFSSCRQSVGVMQSITERKTKYQSPY